MENPIIVISSSEDEQENRSTYQLLRPIVEAEAFIREKKKNQTTEEEMEGVASGSTTTRRRAGSKVDDEYKVISNLVGFDNLRGMIEAGALIRGAKKKRNVDFCAQEEKQGNGAKAKKRKRCKLDEYDKIWDLSGFPNLRAMMEAETFLRRRRKNKRNFDSGKLHNELETDSLIILSSTEDEGEGVGNGTTTTTGAGSKVDEYREISNLVGFDNLREMIEAEASIRRMKKKRNVEFCAQEEIQRNGAKAKKRKRCKLDEYDKISDLSGFPNLRAMMEAETFLRRVKNKRSFDSGKLLDELKIDPLVILSMSSEEEEINGTKGKRRGCDGTKRSNLDEYRKISDLSGFDNLKAMIEAEASMGRKKRRKKKRKLDSGKLHNELKTDPSVILTTSIGEEEINESKGEGRGCEATKRSNLDEYRKISDLSGFDNLKAMIEAEASMGRKKGRKKKRKLDSGKLNNELKTDPSVILTPSTQEEEINETKGKIRGCEGTKTSNLDECRKISDLSGFDNLKTMIEAEASMGRKKGKKKKRKLDSAKLHNELKTDPLVILTTSTEEEEINETKGKRRGCEGTKRSNLDEYRKISDLSGFDNLKAMIEAEASMGRKKRKKKRNVEFYAQEDVMGKYCSVCRGENHLANNNAETELGENLISKICLKCGDSGHDMFSCTVDYPVDDLKGIQCYMCKKFGHLCCVNYPDTGPKQASCYNCGQSGHMGYECIKSALVPWDTKFSILCFKHGKDGHFAKNHARLS